jgi:Zn-dependent peptidase ImmA (M78 family)/transcriptional regulator with XRE-family HTH domain
VPQVYLKKGGSPMPKSSADVAFVNPSIIQWAIQGSQLSRATIARKLKISTDQLERWESGQDHPPFVKAEALAKLFNIPFGYLYLPEEPKVTLPLPDFRTLNKQQRPPTQEFLQLLSDILVKQDWYKEYLRDSGRASRLKFVDSFDYHTATPGDVAVSIRSTLDINLSLRNSVSSWSEYLSTLTRHAEDAGVLVMRSSIVGNITRRPVSVEEVQGFAMADPLAPVVFVNSGDYKAAQIFTLAHELAHIWIGQSAIGDPNPLHFSGPDIETFCNRVATAVLVPKSQFISAWNALAENDARISTLARRFWVSTIVILRRARELELISVPEFNRLREDELKKTTEGQTTSGGDFYRNVFARMSPRFTNAVLAEVNQSKTLLRDGARLLGISVPTLAKFAEMVK